EVTQEENDQGQLKAMMGAAQATLKKIGYARRMGTALADAGYGCERNLEWAADGRGKTDYLIATLKDWKQRKALRNEPVPVGRTPGGMNVRERMERKLRTQRGRRLYKRRGCTVEPTFGQVKTVQGFEGFSRRGMGRRKASGKSSERRTTS
ncbi:MAG: transposase, partial [bacterium]